MRFLVRLILALTLLFMLVWGGAQIALIHQARAMLAAEPSVTVTGLKPLRDPRRVGLSFAAARLEGGPELDDGAVWVPMLAPNRLRARLPSSVTARPGTEAGPVMLNNGIGEIAVAPLNGLTLSRALVAVRGLSDDQRHMVSGPLSLRADLAPMGTNPPATAKSAYRVTLTADSIQTGKLVSLLGGAALPDMLDRPARTRGEALVFLDGVVRPLSAGTQNPRVVGIHSDGITLELGEDSAKLLARISFGPDGVADGHAYIDTADAENFLNIAAQLGLIPEGSIKLALTALGTISAQSAAPGTEAATGAATGGGATPADAIPSWLAAPVWPPAPAPGMLRLPFRFADGKSYLGPFPLGPAPRLR